MTRQFTLEYWMDDGWYIGRLKEVPSVFSQGETLAELEENIREAYQLMFEEDEVLPYADVQTKEIRVEEKTRFHPRTYQRWMLPQTSWS